MANKTTFKKKALLLSVTAAALVVLYAGTVVFDPERASARNSFYTWLDSSLIDRADTIEITGSAGGAILSRKNNLWTVSGGGTDYPAKQLRVSDLFTVLSRRGPYPVRSTSASALEPLGLTGDKASRITVRGGAGLPLLDLLIGFGGAAGSEVYLRKAAENTARSGEDSFSLYTEGSAKSWYDLRLFPGVSAALVQRARVTQVDSGVAFIISRSGNGWTVQDSPVETAAPAETSKVESWLRSVIDAEGEDFAEGLFTGSPGSGGIVLELGDGTARTLSVGPADDQNRRTAGVSNAAYSYTLAEWMVKRLFQDKEEFTRP
jgi:hypothetical protein